MARLAISLLGPFHAQSGGQNAPGFGAPGVRALLAYLAVEAGDHTRRDLAGLLWPEQPEQTGLSNLRYALSDLRRALGDGPAGPGSPGLLATRECVGLDDDNLSLDVRQFERLCGAPPGREESQTERERLEQAAALYRGLFLEGFALPGSISFEDWLYWTRERFQRAIMGVLRQLVTLHEGAGQYEAAQTAARRQVHLEPLDEAAHRQLMHVLAVSGQRSAALTQYESCRRTLAQELGVEPMPETVALEHAIRSGTLGSPANLPGSPAGSSPVSPIRPFNQSHGGARAPTAARAPVFVAREQEMRQLEHHLALALGGEGRVVFVTGEAGSGKTVLMAEFVRRALAAHADLVAADGSCDAATGAGNPYLPFRQILQILAGDIEARRAAGAISAELAGRLWSLLPYTVEALLDQGPDLIDIFVPGPDLLLRVDSVLLGRKDGAAWQARLAKAVEGRTPPPRGGASPQQPNAGEQVSRVLQEISRQRPLVLVLDDLQWVDSASADLLFHLGRHLAGSRILILGAYRSPDIALGRDGARHPLAGAINEFQREFGENQVDLTQAAGREFLEAFLDSEPNHLDRSFRDLLYEHTGGQALFTVELLRALEAGGSLVRDAGGCWIEGPDLNWQLIPARVEAVIAERIERLPQEAQALLGAASVEGEQFTAEVAACLVGIDRIEALGRLNGTLGRQHRLVRGDSVVWLESGKKSLSRYRFQHVLFREYLYRLLDPVERVRLHQLTGEALEELYAPQTAHVAIQLAHHFEQAGRAARAVDYLLEAGRQATQLAAYQEAAADYNRGLALLARLPESAERAQRELRLRLGLAGSMAALHGWADPARASAVADAVLVTGQAGGREAAYALYLQADLSRSQGHLERAVQMARQMLARAEISADRQETMLAHISLGPTLFFQGKLAEARVELEESLRLYRNDEDRLAWEKLGIDAQAFALSCLSPALWALGYPEQAARRAREAIARAGDLDEAWVKATVLSLLIVSGLPMELAEDRRDEIATLRCLVDEKGLPSLGPVADMAGGWLMAREGRVAVGVEQMRRSIAAWRAGSMPLGTAALLTSLAQVCLRGGLYDEGLQAVDEATAYLEAGIGHIYEAELCRLRGALTLGKAGNGSLETAEAYFLKAVDIARAQGARSWELRATKDLACLWLRNGRQQEAHARLAAIVAQFDEGLATPDLRDAAALLEELARAGDTGRWLVH